MQVFAFVITLFPVLAYEVWGNGVGFGCFQRRL